ncbi:MAG: L-lysine 6-transaminase [Planctomycetota bacterium]
MIDANQVHATLKRHQLADGLPLVMDLERSHGCYLHDALSETDYLDGFTCFATWPVGYNHPMLREPAFAQKLLRAATCNPTSSDLYTREMAAFVEAFATRVTPSGFPHHFWVAGGALAVENALKTAFDWKARKLGRSALDASVNDLVILHFREAFHGRSGYTLSLTNTDPNKIGLFPKFDWPRVTNPKIEFGADGEIANDIEAAEAQACREIEAAIARHRNRIAAIIIEPMQGEGGDNHFRAEFLSRLRSYANEIEALLIFDEVQTGFFGSGKPWLWQHLGVVPDVVSFGKKTQVCGIYASPRIDEVADHVFARAGRINSTWGGNLVDMVRCHRFIDIIDSERLADNVAAMGELLVRGLRELARDRRDIGNVRGRGSLVAFTLESGPARERFLKALLERKLLALRSGPCAIRLRLPFVIGRREVDQIVERVAGCLPARV